MRLTPEIKAEYEQKRTQAQSELEARQAAVYALSPRLKAIAAARREAIFALGRARLADAPGAPGIQAQLEALDKEQADILQALALPQDALSLRYECPLCKDTGYVGETRRMCACLTKRLCEASLQNANLRETDRFERFDSGIYPTPKQRDNALRVRDALSAYAAAFPGDGRGLLLMGETGLGKTFLLNCVAHSLLERGFTVMDMTAYRLMQEMIESIRDHIPAPDYTAPDALIIDDLGGEPKYGDIGIETLFSVLNERQSLNKPTLVASNMEHGQIFDNYGERLYSRLTAPRLTASYRLNGEDLRRIKHQ